jgi:hypothetical protein
VQVGACIVQNRGKKLVLEDEIVLVFKGTELTTCGRWVVWWAAVQGFEHG